MMNWDGAATFALIVGVCLVATTCMITIPGPDHRSGAYKRCVVNGGDAVECAKAIYETK